MKKMLMVILAMCFLSGCATQSRELKVKAEWKMQIDPISVSDSEQFGQLHDECAFYAWEWLMKKTKDERFGRVVVGVFFGACAGAAAGASGAFIGIPIGMAVGGVIGGSRWTGEQVRRNEAFQVYTDCMVDQGYQRKPSARPKFPKPNNGGGSEIGAF